MRDGDIHTRYETELTETRGLDELHPFRNLSKLIFTGG